MILLVVVAFLAFGAITSTPAVAGGALATCKNWYAYGTGPNGGANSVGADCKRADGSWNRTEVWMPGCVRAGDGPRGNGLYWQRDGFFDRVCKNCWVGADRNANTFRPYGCTCKKLNSGDWQESYLMLNLDDMSNQNGNLQCPI
ncbi:CVNH domain-containing protein [Verminephrobacter eiseniae]|uniref:CVNH domain-containing protein n=1 Tax=Verminephrobacter eiseniae TaxID=364317 RepID=UPI0038B2F85E